VKKTQKPRSLSNKERLKKNPATAGLKIYNELSFKIKRGEPANENLQYQTKISLKTERDKERFGVAYKRT